MVLGLTATGACLMWASASTAGTAALVFERIGLRSYGVFLSHLVVMRLLAVPLLGDPATALRTSALWPLHMTCMLVLVTALSYATVSVLWRIPMVATIVGRTSD
jgi:hypothetical protein